MGVCETEAIVLRTYKLAEADKIAVFLSQHFGIMRGVARGARRLKSKFGASLEPYTVVSLSYYEKEGQELLGLRQADIVRSYFELSTNTEAVSALEYISGLILEFTPPHEPNERVFRMFRACLEAIAASPGDVRQITRYGELWLLKLSGFLPDVYSCVNCKQRFGENNGGIFLGIDGGLRCQSCANRGDLPINSESAACLRRVQRQTPGEWSRSSNTASDKILKDLSQVTHRLITRALERLPRGRTAIE